MGLEYFLVIPKPMLQSHNLKLSEGSIEAYNTGSDKSVEQRFLENCCAPHDKLAGDTFSKLPINILAAQMLCR